MSSDLVERLNRPARGGAKGQLATTMAEGAARIEELEAVLDAQEREHRYGNGNFWRFWSDQAKDTAKLFKDLRGKNARARDALENLGIAISMGWDLDGVMGVARQVLLEDGRETPLFQPKQDKSA